MSSSPWRIEAALQQRTQAARAAFDSAGNGTEAFRAAVRFAGSLMVLAGRELPDAEEALRVAAAAVWNAGESLARLIEQHVAALKDAAQRERETT